VYLFVVLKLAKDRIPDVVERVNAHALAALQAQCAEPGGELAYGSVGAAGRDVVGGIQGGDVDLKEMGCQDGWEGGFFNGGKLKRVGGSIRTLARSLVLVLDGQVWKKTKKTKDSRVLGRRRRRRRRKTYGLVPIVG